MRYLKYKLKDLSWKKQCEIQDCQLVIPDDFPLSSLQLEPNMEQFVCRENLIGESWGRDIDEYQPMHLWSSGSYV